MNGLDRSKWLAVALGAALIAGGPGLARGAAATTAAQGAQQAPTQTGDSTADDADASAALPLSDQAPGDTAQAAGPRAAGARCWQQAGISKESLRQRKTILENANSQMLQVYQDTSLTPQQQRQQIRAIRRSAKMQVGKLMTPEQRQALQQCQLDRRGATPPANSPAPPANSTSPAPATQPN